MSNASRAGIAAMGALLAVGGFWAGKWRGDRPAAAPTKKVLFYRNPMDPSIRSEVPGERLHGDGLHSGLRGAGGPRSLRRGAGVPRPFARATAAAGCAERPGDPRFPDEGDSHGRARGRRRAAPATRPREVRRIRGAPLRGLHGQVRDQGRAPPLDLQPRSRRHPAGVSVGVARPGRAGTLRKPFGRPRGARSSRGGAATPSLLGHSSRRHRAPRGHGARYSALSTYTPSTAATSSRRTPSTGCGSRRPTRSTTSRTSLACGSWPTSTSPTSRRSGRGWGPGSRFPICRAGAGTGRSPTSPRLSKRGRAPSRSGSRWTTRAAS